MNKNTGIIAVLVILIAGAAYIGLRPETPVTTDPPQTSTEQDDPETSTEPETPPITDQTEPEEQTTETTPPVDPPKEPEKTGEEHTYTVSDLYIVNMNTETLHETQIRATISDLVGEPRTISLPVIVDGEKDKVPVELESSQTLFIQKLRFYPPGEYNLTVGDAWMTFDTYLQDSWYSPHTMDLTDGVPQFVSHDFTDLDEIQSLSKFRSSAGHSFTDDFEECRSMKHYYTPKTLDNTNPAYSPVDGRIMQVKVENRWPGAEDDYMVVIEPDAYPGIHFTLFHVLKHENITIGAKVKAGDSLGTFQMYYQSTDEYAGDYDISVGANTPEGYRLISYFETMTPELLLTYETRGATIDDLIITREQRDAAPFTCDEESFTTWSEDDWVQLD